jgi:hypothetical protein
MAALPIDDISIGYGRGVETTARHRLFESGDPIAAKFGRRIAAEREN